MKILDFYMECVLPVILLICFLVCYIALGILVFTQQLNWLEWAEVILLVLFSPVFFEMSKTLLKVTKSNWRNNSWNLV